MKRTLTQNSAMHLFYSRTAEQLNDAGLDMKKVLQPHIDIPWTPEMVKEHLWRTVQIVMFNKESTTELNTKQVSQIYEVMNRHLSQNHGVSVPFPELLQLV